MKKPCEASIFICSIVKNAAKGLSHNVPVIEQIRKNFKSSKVYVYENDSTDGTKEILKAWAATDPNNITVSLNTHPPLPHSSSPEGINPFFSKSRIEKMVFLRNNYLEFISQIGWNGDYLMVVDLDVVSFKAKDVMSSFDTIREWDAVTAYGYSLSPKLTTRYHDTYAYISLKKTYEAPQSERDIYKCQHEFLSLNDSDKWQGVKSAFGGLAIYRWKAIRGLRYILEYNADPRVEVYCEHRSIFKQMYERGYTHFYINPVMKIKYQEINLSLVKGFFQRMQKKILHRFCSTEVND